MLRQKYASNILQKFLASMCKLITSLSFLIICLDLFTLNALNYSDYLFTESYSDFESIGGVPARMV